jgi:hypothetical protein
MNFSDISDTFKKYLPFFIVGGVAFLFTNTILAIVIPLGIGVVYYNKEKIPKIFSSKQKSKPFPQEEDEKKPEKKEQNLKPPEAEKQQNETETAALAEDKTTPQKNKKLLKKKIPLPKQNLANLSLQKSSINQ